MKRIFLFVLVLCPVFFVSTTFSQNDKVVKKIIEIGKTDNQTMHHLDVIPDFPFKMEKRKPRKQPKVARGTDSGPFSVAGVTTMGFGTGDTKGYNFSYMEIWHTERDLYNKSIPEYQEHTSIVTAIVVYGIANLDHLLSREGYFAADNE